MRTGSLRVVLLGLLVLGSVGCGTSEVDGVVAPDRFDVSEVITGLDRPTQVVVDPEGRLLVAQLAGAEREGTGQVLRIDPADPSRREVLAGGLSVPTGIALSEGELWIMERQTLSRRPIGSSDGTVVVDDLPSNGRSNGTLTVLGDGRILFNTSGSIRGGSVVEGSGRLWTVTAGTGPVEFASGFKHAYAHTVDADGALWTTEIGDGRYDGERPPDELVAVAPGLDHGWPRCIGDNVPVVEFGGSDATCVDAPASLAVFEPGATPTSVVVAPWNQDTLLVALWNSGLVVSVDRATGEVATFLTGIAHPQHLVVDGDRVLIVDHEDGRILAVEER